MKKVMIILMLLSGFLISSIVSGGEIRVMVPFDFIVSESTSRGTYDLYNYSIDTKLVDLNNNTKMGREAAEEGMVPLKEMYKSGWRIISIIMIGGKIPVFYFEK